MNIRETNNPNALPNLEARGRALHRMCNEQPVNVIPKDPATWHLAVTLQSNNPKVTFDRMDSALTEWDWLINRDALGKRSTQHLSKHWRWIAAYEGHNGDDHNTPHWHLIMTTGFGIKPEKADELLAEKRVDVAIKNGVITGARRVTVAQATFSRYWTRLMPKGEVRASYLHHPSDEKAWMAYIMKYVEGRRLISPDHMAFSQDSIRIGGHGFQDRTVV